MRKVVKVAEDHVGIGLEPIYENRGGLDKMGDAKCWRDIRAPFPKLDEG